MKTFKMFLKFLFAFLFAVLINVQDSLAQSSVGDASSTRSREYFQNILNTDYISGFFKNDLTKITLEKLLALYMKSIKPLEDAYCYNDMNNPEMNEGKIFAVPKITLLGPWSTGKSSLINYILGIENSSFSLMAGAQPTTSDFTILTYNSEQKVVDGNILVMEKSYSSLEKYGETLLERLMSLRIPNDILKWVNFVDSPGVIENRKQQERGFPFIEISKWFIDQSDLVIFVFDPAKLDVGIELAKIFEHLKGYEAKVRIVLNKADSINSQELLRVYGSLFWNLSPLVNVTEPPQVYVSSFWSKPFQRTSKEYHNMFVEDEKSLLKDIYEVMSNRLQNKIASFRRHAVLVRNHALMVDSYIGALAQHRSVFQSGQDVANSISEMPHKYRVYQKVLAYKDISEKDLFSVSDYQTFFSLHSMENFMSLSKHCGFISLCLLDAIEKAIYEELPDLLSEVTTKQMRVSPQRKSRKSASEL